MPWAAAAAAAAAVGGAVISSDASSSAANKQQASTQKGIDEQSREFGVTQSQTAPYRSAGNSALATLSGLLGNSGTVPLTQDNFNGAAYLAANPDVAADAHYGSNPYQHYLDYGQGEISGGKRTLGFDMPTAASAAAPIGAPGDLTRKFGISDFWSDPVVQASYQSGLDLGTKALRNAAPLTTGLDSGAAMKELTKFGTDYTGNMAAGSQARFVGDQTNTFNKLAAVAGIGQTAVGQTTAAGTNTANNISQMITAQGNAGAASSLAKGNAYSGGINSIANWWQQQNMVNQMTNNGVGNGYYGGSGSYNPSAATYNSSMYGY